MAKPIEEMSTAALAYLGDSIIELCVRETLVQKGVSSAKNLNSTALLFVKAEAVNCGEGEMYCSFGSHESYLLEGNIEDYCLKFEKKENFHSNIVTPAVIICRDFDNIPLLSRYFKKSAAARTDPFAAGP